MNRTYHQEIFYPNKINFNQKETQKIQIKDNCLFIVLPHSSYNYIQDILQIAFNSIKDLNFDLITILSSLHRPLLIKDKECYVVTRPSGKIENEQYSIPLVSLEENKICVNEDYFIEESAPEIILPFVSLYFKNTPVLELSSYEYSLKLESLLEKIKTQNARNLFIIMDNFTEKTGKDVPDNEKSYYTIEGKILNPTSGIWLKTVKGNWKIIDSYKKHYTYCFATRKES